MKLRIEFSERASCYAALHSADTTELFKSNSRHFCRALRLQRGEKEDKEDIFVGWVGDHSLNPGCLELSKPFAECLGLEEGQLVDVVAHSAPVASTVMVQPILDFTEVVCLHMALCCESERRVNVGMNSHLAQ